MQIGDITSSIDAPVSTSNSTAANALGGSQEEFLKLFVAQLENQDPLDPRDGAEMVAELAQFSQVEQTAAINSRLDALAAQGASSSRAQMLGLVGHTVEASADTVALTGTGTMPQIDLKLDKASSKTTAIIRDASGKEVRRLDLGARPAGKAGLGWDGTGAGGTQLPPGSYTIEIEAADQAGNAISSSTSITGVVDAVQFSDDGTQIRIGGLVLNPSDVSSVGL